jgi:hypothetical protein
MNDDSLPRQFIVQNMNLNQEPREFVCFTDNCYGAGETMNNSTVEIICLLLFMCGA